MKVLPGKFSMIGACKKSCTYHHATSLLVSSKLKRGTPFRESSTLQNPADRRQKTHKIPTKGAARKHWVSSEGHSHIWTQKILLLCSTLLQILGQCHFRFPVRQWPLKPFLDVYPLSGMQEMTSRVQVPLQELVASHCFFCYQVQGFYFARCTCSQQGSQRSLLWKFGSGRDSFSFHYCIRAELVRNICRAGIVCCARVPSQSTRNLGCNHPVAFQHF